MQDTRNRVPANTDAEINRKIRDQTAARIRYYQRHKDGIHSRLSQVDEEWDIERATRPRLPSQASSWEPQAISGGSFCQRW